MFFYSIPEISEFDTLSNIKTLPIPKRCLTGTAKIFLIFLPTITFWVSFQSDFLDKFPGKFTETDINKFYHQAVCEKAKTAMNI